MSETVENAVEASAATKRKRILLAEDDSTSRLFLLNQLKKRGLDVDTAPNGNIALKKFKGGGFDAVILDLMLPGIRGKELIKEIRKTKHGADIPIFAVTSAERMELWRKRGTKAGATKVLDKAAPVERIAAEIAAYLNPKPKEAKPPKQKEQEVARVESKPSAAGVAAREDSSPNFQGTDLRPTPNQPGASTNEAPRQYVHTPIRNMFNTAFLRKVAEAGKAARGTPPPPSAGGSEEEAEKAVASEPSHLVLTESDAPNVGGNRPALSADTPLNFGDFPEEVSSQPEEVLAQTPDAVEMPKEPAATAAPLNPEPLPSTGTTPIVSGPPATEASARTNDEVRELQEQLAELRRNRDELALLLQKQTQIAAQPDPAMQKVLAEAKAAAQCAEEAYQAEFLRAREYQEELARIREARNELDRKLAQSGSVVAENRQRSEEMEKHLAQCLAELERAKAELQKSTAERSALESELREQVSGARKSAETAKVACEEQAARATRLGEELNALRQAREDLNARLSAEMQAAAESKRRMAEYELQLRDREAEVERLKEELQRHAADKELSKKLSAAQVAASDAQAVYKEEAARGAQSKKKLTKLNQEREELNARLSHEEQAAAEARRRSEEMEQQLAARNAELERLKAELDRRAEERKTLEERLQRQVAQATEAAKEAARREVKAESSVVVRSPAEVAALRRARDELNAKLEREQQAAAQSRRQSEEAERKLQSAAQELAQLRTELEKRAKERGPAATVTPDAPQRDAVKRPGLAERLAAPFRIFSSRSGARTIQDLEEQIAEVTRNRDELLILLRDRPILSLDTAPSAKPGTLNEAQAAARRAEAAHQAELARSRQFEEELKRIRQTRDDLNRKLADQEKAAEESRRRSQELEDRLAHSDVELAKAKADLEKTVAQHSAAERDLRGQLESTRQFAQSTKLAHEKQAALSRRSLEELTALRNAGEALDARLRTEMQAAVESKRRGEEFELQLRQKEAEVERLKTEVNRRAADAELAKKLRAAQSLAQNAQAACKEEATRGAEIEQELVRLKQAREGLNARLTQQERAAAEVRSRSEEIERTLGERTAELDRLKSELQRHGEQRKALERQLQQQVARASEAATSVRNDFQQETSFFHRSTGEAEALRRARDELNGRIEREQQITAESRRHIEELEGQVQAAANEMAQLRGELEKRTSERADMVTASSRQFQAAKAETAKAEKAYKEQLRRAAKFEKELAALRQNSSASGGSAKSKRKSTAKSTREIQELEMQAAAHAAELEKARAEFEEQLRKRDQLESEHKAAREKSAGSGPSSVPATADARFRESINAFARITAQIEKEQADRRRVDERAAFLTRQLQYLQEELRKHIEIEKETQQRITEFEERLRERDAELAGTSGLLQQESAARKLVEAQLKATGQMGSQFQEQFSLMDEAKRVFNAAQEQVQARLDTTLAAQREIEGKLQTQIAERKRVKELLEDIERQLQEQSQQSTEEMARLQSVLELETIERRKQESRSLQSQYSSLDASRLGRSFVNSFRAHLRTPAHNLLERARRLAELPLQKEAKKLVEAALESALMLQTSMQENAPLPGETNTPEAAKAA